MTAPSGYAQLLALGDPRAFIRPDGSIDAEAFALELGLVVVDFPAPLPLSWATDHTARSLRCHPIAYAAFRSAFSLLWSEGLWPHLKTFGGGYAPRLQRGSSGKLSTHSWGLAADFDTIENPLGAPSRIDPAVVKVFQGFGFTWGGTWARVDAGHFQYASGY